jgi:hypothetical protein
VSQTGNIQVEKLITDYFPYLLDIEGLNFKNRISYLIIVLYILSVHLLIWQDPDKYLENV